MTLAPAIALATLATMIMGFPASAVEDEGTDPGELVGVWTLKSFHLQVLGSNEFKEVFGPKPRGYLIFSREGRMMTIITRTDRKPATTLEEQAALLQSMVSYTGRYKVEGDRIVTTPDVSWNEIYTGSEQIRYYTLRDEELSLTTALQASGVLPDNRVVATLTYTREE
jgi:hypothetical protein